MHRFSVPGLSWYHLHTPCRTHTHIHSFQSTVHSPSTCVWSYWVNIKSSHTVQVLSAGMCWITRFTLCCSIQRCSASLSTSILPVQSSFVSIWVGRTDKHTLAILLNERWNTLLYILIVAVVFAIQCLCNVVYEALLEALLYELDKQVGRNCGHLVEMRWRNALRALPRMHSTFNSAIQQFVTPNSFSIQ